MCHCCMYNTGLNVLQDFAKSKGGELLSTEYKNILDTYEWKCCNNHIFTKQWSVRKDNIK